jgi:(p)ppGpp synthase/HD superfamily hydrolase
MNRRVSAALAFAAKAHKGQFRKGPSKEPYINHPIRVIDLLVSAGITKANTLATAALHDILEDTDTTYETLKENFGSAVANGVLFLTSEQEKNLLQKKLLQAKKIARAKHDVKLVKLADQIDNLFSIITEPPGWSRERIIDYASGAQLIAKACAGNNNYLDITFKTNHKLLMADHPITEKDLSRFAEAKRNFEQEGTK